MPLRLVRRPRSPFWYIRGSIRGLGIVESTGLVDRAAAEDLLALRTAEIVKRAVHGDSATRTFAEAALSYMEAGGERVHLNPLIRHFARTPLGRIGQAEVDEAARKLKPGVGPATLNRHVYTPVAAVLHHAARKRWCEKPVIARPAQPRGRVRYATFEEAERLIAAAAPHLKPLVIFLFSTGARLSEALYLDWREVDLSAAHVVFHDTKNGESRGGPLHPRVVAALACVEWPREGAVFRRPAGKIRKTGRLWLPYTDRGGKGGGQVKTAWAGMLARAGMADFTPHDCRHTWATWHYRRNRDLAQLMQLGGWKSPDMVLRYAHVNTSHLAGSIADLWEDPTPRAAEGSKSA